MSNIKDQIVTLLKQRHHSHKVALEQEKDPRSKHAVDLIARIREDSKLIELIDSLPEEKPSEDLEEAADKHIRKVVDVAGHPGWDWETQDIKEAFIAGAEWQKEQMMKGAVEAKIYGYDDGSFELIASWLDMPNNSIYKDGEKVKIIIVKK